MEIDKGVNQRVGEIRRALKLTQKKFADGIKISKAYVGAIELNRRRVNDRIIKIISFTYSVNEDWVKTGAGTMFNECENHKLEEVIHNFKRLDNLLQDYVLKQIHLALEYQEMKR